MQFRLRRQTQLEINDGRSPSAAIGDDLVRLNFTMRDRFVSYVVTFFFSLFSSMFIMSLFIH